MLPNLPYNAHMQKGVRSTRYQIYSNYTPITVLVLGKTLDVSVTTSSPAYSFLNLPPEGSIFDQLHCQVRLGNTITSESLETNVGVRGKTGMNRNYGIAFDSDCNFYTSPAPTKVFSEINQCVTVIQHTWYVQMYKIRRYPHVSFHHWT